jgi:hypothetical protein
MFAGHAIFYAEDVMLSLIPFSKKLIPQNPQVTVERDADGKPLKVEVDIETERILQNQRLFAAYVGGPLVIYAGHKMDAKMLTKAVVMGLGAACIYSHLTAYAAVREALETK